MLRFNTHYLVSTVANGGGIDGFALAQAGNEEVVGHFFGGFYCITGMHGKTLLSTARHHHCNSCSQYHFFHFIIPDNIIFPAMPVPHKEIFLLIINYINKETLLSARTLSKSRKGNKALFET